MLIDASIVLGWAMVFQAAAPPSEPATHVTLEREFVFMSSSRVTRIEQWFAGDRKWEKRGGSTVVTRRDLGVRWVIDENGKTYTEVSLREESAPPPVPASDLRVAGFNYEPVFDWTVSESGKTRMIQGRSCSELRVDGDADYAETSFSFWLCPRGERDPSPDANASLLELARNPSVRDFASAQLRQRGDPLLMMIEERTEPAISPVMVTSLRIAALESAVPPPGLFELPPGVKKEAPRQ